MESFVCDLWYEDELQEEQMLGMAISEAYENRMYPNGKLIIGSKSVPLRKQDIQNKEQRTF